nr:Myc-type, basic helix-loop-helix (bHLH) domain-containing protein [Tanacetum cinerariifolium]
MVPLMLQQAVSMLAGPKEKLKEMESERSGSHGSTSMETPNNSYNGSSLKKVEIKADKDQVTVISKGPEQFTKKKMDVFSKESNSSLNSLQ